MPILLIFSISFPSAQETKISPSEVTRLSLKEATELALLNNFDIQLAKYDAWIAQTKEGEARSIYDTILDADIEYRNNQLKKTSTIAGNKIVDNDYNLGLSKKLPTGTTVNLDMENSRNWTNSSVATNALTHDSALKAEVVQELGKNFLGIQDRGDVKLTLLDIENSSFTSLDQIESSIAEVQKAYWDVVLETEYVHLSEEMLAQAKKLFVLHQEKFNNGLVELPELLAAEANYEQRQNEWQLAVNEQENKVNTLKFFLNIEIDTDLVPSEALLILDEGQDFIESLKRALENRQDYKKTLNIIKAKKLQLTMKKNNFWPEMNLTASLKRNGLGDHFRQAVEQISEEDNPEIFAGLNISIPLENNEAKSQFKAAELEKAKALIELKLVERKVATVILNQARDCQVLQQSAMTKEKIAELQKKKFEEQEKRFSRGRSDTDTLIRFQEDFLKAQKEAAQSKYEYQLSLIDLKREEGTLLKEYWNGDF